MTDFISSAKKSIASADINARKDEIADTLQEIAGMLREKDVNNKRDELLAKLADVSEKVKSFETSSQEKISERLDELEAYIKEHPITAVAVALGAGFFFGNLFRKS